MQGLFLVLDFVATRFFYSSIMEAVLSVCVYLQLESFFKVITPIDILNTSETCKKNHTALSPYISQTFHFKVPPPPEKFRIYSPHFVFFEDEYIYSISKLPSSVSSEYHVPYDIGQDSRVTKAPRIESRDADRRSPLHSVYRMPSSTDLHVDHPVSAENRMENALWGIFTGNNLMA